MEKTGELVALGQQLEVAAADAVQGENEHAVDHHSDADGDADAQKQRETAGLLDGGDEEMRGEGVDAAAANAMTSEAKSGRRK